MFHDSTTWKRKTRRLEEDEGDEGNLQGKDMSVDRTRNNNNKIS